MNIISETRKALIERLKTITKANGSYTDIGQDVKDGWFNEVIRDEAAPRRMIVVQRAKGMEPKGGPHGLRHQPGFLVVGAERAELDDYEDLIEAIEIDLLRCLTPIEGVPPDWLPKGATAIKVGTPDPIPPGQGLTFAAVAVPIHITVFVE